MGRRASGVGVNLVGYFNHVIGLGESARKLERALSSSAVPHATAALGLPPHVPPLPDATTAWLDDALLPFDVTVLWCNPDRYGIDVDPGALPGTKLVGRWAWELPALPEAWRDGASSLCEIWTPSQFVADAVKASVDLPVTVIPMAIDPAPPSAVIDRDRWSATTGRPLFLFMFDHASIAARKNPMGAIGAFSRAFAGSEATLVIKTINAAAHPDEHQQLEAAARAHSSIHVFDVALPSAERSALLAGCDCYVSLHRSEGFGMTIAEAMACARPVIATDFGGSVGFLSGRTGYPVRWTPARVGPGVPIYPEDGRWAEPDLDQAAALMREVVASPAAATRRGRRAARWIASRHAPAAVGRAVARELDRLVRS